MDRNTLAANRRLDNPTVQEWCDQVRSRKTCKKCYNLFLQEDVVLLYPFTEGTKYITYDAQTHRAVLHSGPGGAHLASYSNASRVTTYLRGGVEQLHGALKGTYKVVSLKKSKCLKNVLPTFLFLRFWKGCQPPFSSLLVRKLCTDTMTCISVTGG